MKTFFPLLIILVISNLGAFAQIISVQTGFSSTTTEYKFKDQEKFEDYYDFNAGFQIGFMAEFPLNKIISFVPGVLLQTKGFHTSGSFKPDIEYNWDHDFNLWYLDIPVLLNVNIPVTKIKLFTDIGPYAGIGLSGNYKYKDVIGNNVDVTKGKFNWGADDEAFFKRLEYGALARIGAEVKHVKFGVSYALSLSNIAVNENNTYKNKLLTLFVSYPIFSIKDAINRQ